MKREHLIVSKISRNLIFNFSYDLGLNITLGSQLNTKLWVQEKDKKDEDTYFFWF